MKKSFIVAAALIITLAVSLSGCGLQLPLAEQTIATDVAAPADGKPIIPTRQLYVSGAVQNDGYFAVPQLCDYKTVASIVGVCEYAYMPSNPDAFISNHSNSLIVNYVVGGTLYYSVDVNSIFVTSRLSIDGVDDAVVNKIADYIDVNGKITNRNQLAQALDDDYSANYYKFYISVDDYA